MCKPSQESKMLYCEVKTIWAACFMASFLRCILSSHDFCLLPSTTQKQFHLVHTHEEIRKKGAFLMHTRLCWLSLTSIQVNKKSEIF